MEPKATHATACVRYACQGGYSQVAFYIDPEAGECALVLGKGS